MTIAPVYLVARDPPSFGATHGSVGAALKTCRWSNVCTAYLLKWTYAGQVDFVDDGPTGGVDYPR
ncbi:hypothetical protein, partial [Antrihabitans spumae]